MAESIVPLKYCPKCQKEYPATPEFFHRDSNAKGGFKTICKACRGHKNQYRDYSPIVLPDGIGIPLGNNRIALIDECDSDLAQHKWFAKPSPSYARGGDFMAVRSLPHNGNVYQKTQYLHRVIVARMIGRELERKEDVDHIDSNPLNNRRSNLRLATRAQNGANQRKPSTNTSGFKGVSFHKQRKKWGANIRVNDKLRNLGYFDTPEEAHEAYKKAAVEAFGEFARFE